MSGFNWAFHHETLNRVLASLQKAMLTRSEVQDLEFGKLFPRSGWLATFLANSKDHKHRQKALLFAALSKPWLDLYQARRLRGWRPRSRGLLDAVMRARSLS